MGKYCKYFTTPLRRKDIPEYKYCKTMKNEVIRLKSQQFSYLSCKYIEDDSAWWWDPDGWCLGIVCCRVLSSVAAGPISCTKPGATDCRSHRIRFVITDCVQILRLTTDGLFTVIVPQLTLLNDLVYKQSTQNNNTETV